MSNEELIEEIQKGVNVQINMQRLYNQNRGLIYKWVKPYTIFAEIDDLMQEAFFGLHRAVQKFEFDKGYKFTSYACHWVRQAVGRYCNNGQTGQATKVPDGMRAIVGKFNRFCYEYRLTHGGEYPDDNVICDGMGIDQDKLDLIRNTRAQMYSVSIYEPVPGMEHLTVGDGIPDDYDLEQSITDQEADRSDNAVLWGQVNLLPERQREIILKHFKYDQTYSSIADSFGVKSSRVWQLAAKGLIQLSTNEEMKRIARDRYRSVDPVAYRVGVMEFKHTWTSSTEAAALHSLERQGTASENKPHRTDYITMAKELQKSLKADVDCRTAMALQM